ncbi:MAG TPA: hypothetical protein VIR58_00655 [Acidimicrobiales bacterium]
MSTPRLPATLALVAWTFLVWTTRINNIVADDSLDSGETAARLALSLSFTVLVVAVGWAYSKRAAWLRPATFALAGWTTAVWAVRAVGIAFADHDAAFIAVHLVLAVVSVAIAGLAVRELRAAPSPNPRQ